MRKTLLGIFTFVLVGTSVCLSQNPFDIKGRKSASETVTPVKTDREEAREVETLTEEPVIEDELEVEVPVQVESVYSDSQDNPFEVSHVPLRKSDFRSKTMTREALEVSKKNFFQRNIPLFFILISLVILAIVMGFRENVIKKSFRAFYNPNYLKLIKAESLFGIERSYILLYILFFMNAAVALNHFIYRGDNSFKRLMLVFFAVVAVYFVRHASLWVLGNVFKGMGKKTSDYSFSVHISNIVFGVILLPLNIIMIYAFPGAAKFFMFLIIILGLLIYLNRVSRGVLMSLNYLSSSRFHFFLYLCTCEIGPLLIITKFLSSVIN
jgi:hypothetical protein